MVNWTAISEFKEHRKKLLEILNEIENIDQYNFGLKDVVLKNKLNQKISLNTK